MKRCKESKPASANVIAHIALVVKTYRASRFSAHTCLTGYRTSNQPAHHDLGVEERRNRQWGLSTVVAQCLEIAITAGKRRMVSRLCVCRFGAVAVAHLAPQNKPQSLTRTWRSYIRAGPSGRATARALALRHTPKRIVTPIEQPRTGRATGISPLVPYL
jgi:hypothetical protein